MNELVKVKWVDSTMIGGWHAGDDSFVPVQCESVGWVIQDDDDMIVMVQTRGEPGNQIGNVMSIPKVCITEMVPV